MEVDLQLRWRYPGSTLVLISVLNYSPDGDLSFRLIKLSTLRRATLVHMETCKERLVSSEDVDIWIRL